jgi:hypothetical protein
VPRPQSGADAYSVLRGCETLGVGPRFA